MQVLLEMMMNGQKIEMQEKIRHRLNRKHVQSVHCENGPVIVMNIKIYYNNYLN